MEHSTEGEGIKSALTILAVLLTYLTLIAWGARSYFTEKDAREADASLVRSSSSQAFTVTGKTLHEDEPKFRREYASALADGWSINITVADSWRGRREAFSGFAYGPSGERVYVSHDYPKSNVMTPAARAALAEFFESVALMEKTELDRNRFTDTAGSVWVREQAPAQK